MSDLLMLLGLIFAFALVRGMLDHRAKERFERIRVLEAAIQNPAVDRATVHAIAQQIGQTPISAARWMAFVLAIGWLGMFVGAACWIASNYNEAMHEYAAAGIVLCLVGFAFVTYPFALRELEVRRTEA